jgi:hypothetical protein
MTARRMPYLIWVLTWCLHGLPGLGVGLGLGIGATMWPTTVLAEGPALVQPDAAAGVSIKTQRSYQDALLLDKAWALPVAASYKPHIEFQRNGSFCGPTSLANVQHSLGQAGDQSTVLDGTGFHTWLGYLPKGLTLDELADIARQKLGKRVTVMRGLDLAGFRQQLKLANDPSRRYVINFSRQPLFGAGGGHHSPIAGYLADEDLVLVLDVNSDFGPWLVKPERLWAAMNTVDDSSHKPRGLLLIN